MLISSALVALGATVVAAVKPLKVNGNSFVDDDGNKFQVVGMAYQPGGQDGYKPAEGEDPLSDADVCMRDAALMQSLGINAVRIYNLSPDINHDECATIFNAAGMYMMIDVNSPLDGDSLTSENTKNSYHSDYLNRTFGIVEAFSNYPNTLLFFSSNEIIDNIEKAETVPPYMRAITRDLKNYIKNNIDRQIPVGYSAADVRDVLWDTYNYVTCVIDGDDDDMSRADFFALNSYSWCGKEATFETSSFDKLVEGFNETAVPVFFSEYGCNETPQRFWTETQSIYGEDMYDVFSGGVVYEYTMEGNNYGLVEMSNGSDNSATLLGDYGRLKDQFAKIDWEDVQSRKPKDNNKKHKECKASLLEDDKFYSKFDIPKVPKDAEKMIKNGIDPKPKGKLVKINDWKVSMAVIDENDNELKNLAVKPLDDYESNWSGKNDQDTGSGSSSGSDGDDDDEDAAYLVAPGLWAAAVPLVAMLFA